jgi:hypothetical protein
MPTQLRRFQVMLAKLESTEGTDAVPVGADALQLVAPADFRYGAYQNNEQTDQDNQKLESNAALAPSGLWAEVTFRLYIRGKGATYATTAGPEPHAVLQAALLQESFAAAQWSYDTAQGIAGGQKTLTLYGFRGLDTNVWVLTKILAAKVSRLGIIGEAHRAGIMEVTARGEYVEPADAALITPAYFTSIAPLWKAASSWTLGAFTTGFVKRASVTIENTLQFRDNANSANVRHLITGRRLLWDATVEGARTADYNPWNKWSSRAQEALAAIFGTAGGNNKLQIDADRAQIVGEPVGHEDENGLARYRFGGELDPGGTNRLKLTYTT